MELPKMVGYDAETNTFIDSADQHWAFDQMGNARFVADDYVNPWIPTATVIDQTNPNTGNDWLNLATSALTALQTFQLNQINVNRARQGLPPLNTASSGTGINVGLNPQTQQLVMYGGIALLAILLINSMKR
jgi:hypothetical protein